ncbi:Cyclin-like protein [Amanita muscaria]
MSSNISTRRVTRTGRVMTQKDNENAIGRPSRISTRAKPHNSAIATAGFAGSTETTTRATSSNIASKAKVLATSVDPKVTNSAKRKREALGEVTSLVTNNRSRPPAGKGKTKESADGIVLNKSKATVSRQPLRSVAVTRQTTKATHAIKVDTLETVTEYVEFREQRDENAMSVDPPQPALPTATARRRSLGKQAGAKAEMKRRSIPAKQEKDDEEASRACKKVRTSSDALEEEPPTVDPALLHAKEDEATSRIAAQLEAEVEEHEADPDGSEWDDLDADDVDDPLMVSEYVIEIFSYMKKLELTTLPNPNYMESQKELAWRMRGVLADWLIQVHYRFQLQAETLFLCINIMDRFLSARVVSLAKLQLVGITCLFISAKVEEILAPSVTHFLMCAESTYTEAEILQAERYILKTLDWNLSYPNPMHYLRRVSKADNYNVEVRTLAKYFLEIQCVEWRLVAAPPSLMAAASIWLARIVLGYDSWTPNLAHYSSYPESALVPTANIILNYCLRPIRHASLYRKYAAKRFMKVSIRTRNWALERWSEETQVDLPEDLARLKAEIRISRQAAALRKRGTEADEDDEVANTLMGAQ